MENFRIFNIINNGKLYHIWHQRSSVNLLTKSRVVPLLRIHSSESSDVLWWKVIPRLTAYENPVPPVEYAIWDSHLPSPNAGTSHAERTQMRSKLDVHVSLTELFSLFGRHTQNYTLCTLIRRSQISYGICSWCQSFGMSHIQDGKRDVLSSSSSWKPKGRSVVKINESDFASHIVWRDCQWAVSSSQSQTATSRNCEALSHRLFALPVVLSQITSRSTF